MPEDQLQVGVICEHIQNTNIFHAIENTILMKYSAHEHVQNH